ncbi:MAG: hypothetical protein KF777_15750 [Planctomycetaceae bacterium]|nr:hypothetical protein [Planctomycetaceae bacterium]
MPSRWNTILDAMKTNIEGGTYVLPVDVENRVSKVWDYEETEDFTVQLAASGFSADAESRRGLSPTRDVLVICFQSLERDEHGDVEDADLDAAEATAEGVIAAAIAAIPNGAVTGVDQPERLDEEMIRTSGVYLTLFTVAILDEMEISG